MTASYTAGTVSVTAGSDIVTGSGTGWLASNIAPGYFGVDSANGNPVPVLEVLSDTSMRLVKPWRGTTASGQAYWLSYDTRDGQQTVNNAQRLAEYIALLRSAFFSAFSSLEPAANSIPYFGAGATAALTAVAGFGRTLLATANVAAAWAALGVIPDAQLPGRISELGVNVTGAGDLDAIRVSGWRNVASGGNVATVGGPSGASAGAVLTLMSINSSTGMQLYINQTGGRSIWIRYLASDAWGPWARIGAEIVGGVSSGVGAVMERGGNANGEYIRFADGTQICWGSRTPATTGSANNYFGSTSGAAVFANDTASFPAAFSDTNYRLSINPTFRGFVVLAGYSRSTGSTTSRVGNPGTAQTEVPYDWIATGRWY